MEYFRRSKHPLEDKWFALAEVAGILRISPQTVWRLVIQGELIAVNVSAGKRPTYRVRGCEIVRFITSRQSQRPALPSQVQQTKQQRPAVRRMRRVDGSSGKRKE